MLAPLKYSWCSSGLVWEGGAGRGGAPRAPPASSFPTNIVGHEYAFPGVCDAGFKLLFHEMLHP